jgi:hypothetical protein
MLIFEVAITVILVFFLYRKNKQLSIAKQKLDNEQIYISTDNDDEIDKFHELLNKSSHFLDCMAFNIIGHTADHHSSRLVKKIEEGMRCRFLLFNITKLTSEQARIQLIDGNHKNPDKPYDELVSCITNFEEIIAQLSNKKAKNIEIRLLDIPSTMRYYSFDNKNMIIAPYFANTYRIKARFICIPNVFINQQKYYNDAFDKVWEKSEVLYGDFKNNISDFKNDIKHAKQEYLKYIEINKNA